MQLIALKYIKHKVNLIDINKNLLYLHIVALFMEGSFPWRIYLPHIAYDQIHEFW